MIAPKEALSPTEASEEHPIYRKEPHDNIEFGTQLYFIVCDEGWRESIVCERMYGWAADWFIEIVQAKPYADADR